MRFIGEPLLWFIAPGELPRFLEGTSWRLVPVAAGPAAAGLDRLAVAERV